MRISVPAGASEVYIGRVSLEVLFVLEDGSTVREWVAENLKGRDFIATGNIRDVRIEDFLARNSKCRPVIMQAGIQTVGDLLRLSTYDLYLMMPAGESSRKAIRYLQRYLREFGLALDDDLDEKAPTNWRIPITSAPESGVVYLSYRIYNKLTRKIGVSVLSDLTEYTPEELLKIRGIGKRTVAEIQEIMKGYELSLRHL